jgi:hypothetical protein
VDWVQLVPWSCFLLVCSYSSILKKVSVYSFEPPLNIYQSVWRHVPEYTISYRHRLESFLIQDNRILSYVRGAECLVQLGGFLRKETAFTYIVGVGVGEHLCRYSASRLQVDRVEMQALGSTQPLTEISTSNLPGG